ncbi:MAG: hypothetical protein QM691_01670 [Opitutaceae bacterium]
MKTDIASPAPWAARAILTKGILVGLLGSIHIVGTFTFERETVAGWGPAALRRDYLVWFGVTGVYILLLGLLDLLCHSGVRANSALARRIAWLNAGFTALTGGMGVAVFGFSPPLLLLVTGAMALGALALSRPALSPLD